MQPDTSDVPANAHSMSRKSRLRIVILRIEGGVMLMQRGNRGIFASVS